MSERGDMEHRIEEALMRRSNDIEGRPGAWDGVEAGVRRSHRLRVAASSVAAIALIAAGVFVVPKLTNRTDIGPATPLPNESVEPSPTGSPLPPDWTPLRYDEQGYWLSIPDSFKTGWFEGHAEYRPDGYPGLSVGTDTFAVETFFDSGVPVPDGKPQSVTINGQAVQRWEESDPKAAHTVTYRFDLPCASYPGATEGACDRSAGMLRVIVYASTPDLWVTFGESGETMVRSLHAAGDPMPADRSGTTRYRTFQGSSTVGWDVKTWAVAQFMESRIFGDTARGDAYLTAEAKKQYDGHQGGLDRYDPDSSRRMVTYEIVRRDAVDANSEEFRVRITEQGLDGSKSATTYTETLGVGPGDPGPATAPFQVRFATRDNG